MAIEKIPKRRSVKEQVFEQMKRQLINREWKPGDKLPSEEKLAEAFGVSKVTVRQAMQQLTTLGLIETRLGEGSYVRGEDKGACLNGLVSVAYLGSDIREVMEFRRVIETETAAVAATLAGPEDIAYLRETMERMHRAGAQVEERAKADLDFHYKLACITKNPLIIRTYDILREVLWEAMVKVVDALGSDGAYRFHPRIIKALEEKNEEQAARMMKEHLAKDILFL